MRNIIFDFGNVLVRFDPARVYSTHFADEAKAWWFLRHVATPQWRSAIDAGISMQTSIADLQAQWPEYKEAIEMYRSAWREMLPGEVSGMRQLLAELKATPGVSLFGLTNWSMETFPEARQRFGILQMIEHTVVSGEEGLVKPDPRIFQRLVQRYGLNPHECTFIDDNEANVQAARALGMTGIVFAGADSLRQQLGLWRGLTDAEVLALQSQGCTADDWHTVFVGTATDATPTLQHIVRTHFHGTVHIGTGTTIADCHIANCQIGHNSTLQRIGYIENYTVGANCTLRGIGEMTFSATGATASVMNENGHRSIGLHPGMTVGDAYIWARYRDRKKLMQTLDNWGGNSRGTVGDGTVVRNATAIIDAIIGPGCEVSHGVIAERILLGENIHLEAGLRINDTVVGDNSTLARGEVGCSLIFPAHEQHHNSSFLIASLVQGQSNMASGATVGSNHNGRTADGELQAGRGFWPALCVSLKHNCRFASYTLLAKADYQHELNITLPFSLVSNNTRLDQLEVMPAYWWLYNMYALDRNCTKFAARDKRVFRSQHIEFSPFAPDTAEEMLVGRELLRMWTAQAYHTSRTAQVQAYGMERSHRKTIVLKAAEGYQAYEQMLVYYAISHLPQNCHYSAPIERRWANVGGQLVAGSDMDCLLDDIERGTIASWHDVHNRLNQLWEQYPTQRQQHAYSVLCRLAQKQQLDEADWHHFRSQYNSITQLVKRRIAESRQKDATNEFRQTTFLNTAEMQAVLH